jgi:hypothetical protein
MIDVIHIAVCMKPLEGNFASNAIQYGVAGLNVDGCRVGTEIISVHNSPSGTFAGGEAGRGSNTETYRNHQGRWPANLIHDGSDEVVGLFPETHGAGNKKKSVCTIDKEQVYCGGWKTQTKNPDYHADAGGSASRFFQECKPETESE